MSFFEKHKTKLGLALGGGILAVGAYYLMSPRKNQSIKFKKVLSEDEKKDIISHIEISEKDGYFGPESIISVHKAIVDITIYDQTDLILESRAQRRAAIKDLKQYISISETCHHNINILKLKTQTDIINVLKIDPESWEKSIIRCLVKKNEEVNKFIESEYDLVYSTFNYKHITPQNLQDALVKAKEIADLNMNVGLEIKKNIKDDKVYLRVCKDWVFDTLYLKYGYEEEQIVRGMNLHKDDEDMQDLLIDLYSSLNMWSLQEVERG